MTIPVNRKRFPVVMVAGLIISVLLSFITLNELTRYSEAGLTGSIYLGACIGLLLSAFGLTILSFLEYIKTVFDKNASFEITGHGINDNLSIFSVGDISWTEITRIKILKVYNTDFLIIEVINPQSFIARKNFFKRRPLKTFLRRFGSPVVISQKRIEFNVNQVKDMLIKAKYT